MIYRSVPLLVAAVSPVPDSAPVPSVTDSGSAPPVTDSVPAPDVLQTVETLAVPEPLPRPLLTTSFADYSVTEGLLLLILLSLVAALLLRLVREVF